MFGPTSARSGHPTYIQVVDWTESNQLLMKIPEAVLVWTHALICGYKKKNKDQHLTPQKVQSVVVMLQ